MRWLFTFLLGLLCGAAAMFYLQRHFVPAPAPAVAPAVVIPAPAPTVAVPPAATATTSTTATAAAPVSTTTSTTPAEPVPPAPAEARLLLPVQGVKPEALTDTFDQQRGERAHEAIDIMAPKGTPVLAVADGRIAKLFNSKQGGLTIYEFNPEETQAYYYAHLDRYEPNLKEGQQVKRGDVLGYVGSTGNADVKAPHLHFTVFDLTPDKQWWKGKAINPYPLLRP